MNSKRKIRVIHVISTLNRGGIERFLYDLLQFCDKEKFDMSVCCLGNSGIMKEYYEKTGSQVFLCPYQSPNVLALVLKLFRLFSSVKIDIVHSHVGSFTVWVALAARLARIPTIISTYHNTYRFKPHFRHWAYLRLTRRLVNKQFAVSLAVKRWFQEKYGVCDLEVVYLGVDAQKFSPAQTIDLTKLRDELGIPRGTRIVGTVGNCTAQKDQKTFLKMASAILSSYSGPVTFLIVGDGALRGELEHFAHSLGIRDKVIFTGSREDVPPLMSLMDIFVLTSLWEGLPVTVLEAQALSRPIVASRVPGICEAVVESKTALLADPGAYEEFAKHVLHLLSNPQLAQELGRNGRARVLSSFTIPESVRTHQAIYNDLFHRH